MKIFVSYHYNNPEGGNGFGNIVAIVQKKFFDAELLEMLAEKIRVESGNNEIVILY